MNSLLFEIVPTFDIVRDVRDAMVFLAACIEDEIAGGLGVLALPFECQIRKERPEDDRGEPWVLDAFMFALAKEALLAFNEDPGGDAHWKRFK